MAFVGLRNPLPRGRGSDAVIQTFVDRRQSRDREGAVPRST